MQRHHQPDDEDDFEFASDEASVVCPYCGETVTIGLDHGGGAVQEYVEDCQVCCRPWNVHVRFHPDGAAEVWVEAQE